jgi:hypothetical protein
MREAAIIKLPCFKTALIEMIGVVLLGLGSLTDLSFSTFGYDVFFRLDSSLVMDTILSTERHLQLNNMTTCVCHSVCNLSSAVVCRDIQLWCVINVICLLTDRAERLFETCCQHAKSQQCHLLYCCLILQWCPYIVWICNSLLK